MAWVEEYTRCMDGEYFRGEACPRDGSVSNSSEVLTRMASELRSAGERVTVQALIDGGFDGDWSEVMVSEFLDRGHAPDWLSPND
jgi:hypothetical protein